MRDYYAILGVPRSATTAQINAAFRKLARKYHPDLRPDEHDAVAQFKLATEAHEVLSNVEKRRKYDHSQRPKRQVPVAVRPSPTRPQTPRPAATPPTKPLEVKAEIHLTPEEARHGGRIELRVSVPRPCNSCPGQSHASCAACGGHGFVTTSHLLHVRLPPHLRDGAVLHVPDHGGAAVLNGPPGGLHLRVRVRPCW